MRTVAEPKMKYVTVEAASKGIRRHLSRYAKGIITSKNTQIANMVLDQINVSRAKYGQEKIDLEKLVFVIKYVNAGDMVKQVGIPENLVALAQQLEDAIDNVAAVLSGNRPSQAELSRSKPCPDGPRE
ncbi:MAG: hypothetical protein ABH842_01900 [Candidatus Micrarchaeota archaeon]